MDEQRQLLSEKLYEVYQNTGMNEIEQAEKEWWLPEYMQAIEEAWWTLDFKDKVDLEVKLADSFEKRIWDAQVAIAQLERINQSYEQALKNVAEWEWINAASQGILVAFQKLLDPRSVVRESEYARSSEWVSLWSRIEWKYDKITKWWAGVTVEDLKEFVDLSNEYIKWYAKTVKDKAEIVYKQADTYWLNIDNIVSPAVKDIYNWILPIKPDKIEYFKVWNTDETWFIKEYSDWKYIYHDWDNYYLQDIWKQHTQPWSKKISKAEAENYRPEKEQTIDEYYDYTNIFSDSPIDLSEFE